MEVDLVGLRELDNTESYQRSFSLAVRIRGSRQVEEMICISKLGFRHSVAGPLNTSVAAYQVVPTNFDKESITQTNTNTQMVQ